MSVTSPVSLTKIQAEFGGPNNFSAYVRGGSYVPNTPTNAAISTTVAGLAMSQFVGASKYVPVSASVSPVSVSGSGSGAPGTVHAATTGIATATGSNGTGSYTYSWVRTSGSTLVGIVNSSAANTAFSATLKAPTSGSNTVSATFVCTISDGTSSANTPTVTATCTVTSNA